MSGDLLFYIGLAVAIIIFVLIPNITSLAKRLMTAPLPVIAEAAWRAIQERY